MAESVKLSFRDEIKRELEGATKEQVSFFTWLCAVRALPFLGTEGSFNFWKKDERARHLYAVLFAMDYSAAIYKCLFSNTGSAAYAAYENAYAAARAASTSARAASTSARAASAARAAAYAARAAAYAAAAAAARASAASAARNSAAAAYVSIDWRLLIRSDLQIILTEYNDKLFTRLSHDLAVYKSQQYGDIWQNFVTALKNEGCGYWADLYTNIFNSGFRINDKFKQELERRLSVPKEIQDQGAAAVAKYLTNAESQGTVYTQRETRLIILDSAGAGKTTLARRLNDDESFPDPEDSTHGVDTSINLYFDDTKTQVKTRVWDFGGQVIYHSSHRCFMYANCVYILVVNGRTEDCRDVGRIGYWLDTIDRYSDHRAKVFIVINESDNRRQNTGSYGSLKREYGSMIQEIYGFNIGKDTERVSAFKADLAAYIKETGYQSFGQNDSRAMDKLKAMFDKKKQVLKTGELEKVLKNSGIETEEDQRRAKDLFNTLGVALSYECMEGYVLDPYWISHGVYKVIDYLQKNNCMFINDNELNEVFADDISNYPYEQHRHILDLMEYHDIGFREKGGVRGLSVPCAASLLRPDDIIVNAEPDSLVTKVERDGLEEFPADFFYRYICRNKDNIKGYDVSKEKNKRQVWQTGMVLGKDRSSALVEFAENRRIVITVWGDNKKEYCKQLEAIINDLLHEYRFEPFEQERKDRYGRLEKTIQAGDVVEAASKGGMKAIIEAGAGFLIRKSLGS